MTDRTPLSVRLSMAWIRLLKSPRFQRFTASFPLTRPIALKRTSDVFDLCSGFVYTQTLAACMELGVLEMLDERALTVHEIAEALDRPTDVVQGLLDAAASIHLVRRTRHGLYLLGRHGAPILGNRELGTIVEHNRIFYEDLADPLAVLRGAGSRLSSYWPYAGSQAPSALSPDDVSAYSTFMARSQPLVAEEVLSYDLLNGARRLLDVGGGEGAFLEAVSERHAGLDLHLFDLPAVVARARARFDVREQGERLTTHGGDFLADDLPDVDADVVTLVRVLHDLDDDDAATVLGKVRDRIDGGRTLLVVEPMSGLRGAPRVGPAYFFWYLRAMGKGRPRTPEQIAQMARAAGFRRVSAPMSRNPVIAAILRISL